MILTVLLVSWHILTAVLLIFTNFIISLLTFSHGKEPIETSHKCLILGKEISLIQSNVPNHNHCLVYKPPVKDPANRLRGFLNFELSRESDSRQVI